MTKEKAKKKECCDIKVTKTKDGVQVNIKGTDAKKILESTMKRCCTENCC